MMLMKTRVERVKVDFFAVEEDQRPMDSRLSNWAIWANGRGFPAVSPMFRLYRSNDSAGECNAGGPPVDAMDAQAVSRGVSALPAPHRAALNWYYIVKSGPKRACQQLGTNMQGLAQYVRDGRRMLINRKV